MKGKSISITEEHHFWLANLRDHACLVRNHLTPEEDTWQEIAEQYRVTFEQLQDELQWNKSNGDTPSAAFARRAQAAAYGYFRFEGHMQRLCLHHQVELYLSPSHLNSTLNENQDYLRLLYYWTRGEEAPPLPLADLTGLWLESQLNAMSSYCHLLDETEHAHLQQAEQLKQQLREHLAKNAAIRGYLRFTSEGFPLQISLAIETARTMNSLAHFSIAMAKLCRHNQVSSNCPSFYHQHIQSEASYFLGKLSARVPQIPY